MPSPIMKYFDFAHLPHHLKVVSAEVYNLACAMEALLLEGPEKSAGLRKLLEAKDCFVRAQLENDPALSSGSGGSVGTPPHVQRMERELTDLRDRIAKLGKFIEDSPLFKKLPAAERVDMKDQRKAMEMYEYALSRRVARVTTAIKKKREKGDKS